MSTKRSLVACAAALASLVASACGAGPDHRDPHGVVRTFNRAVLDRDVHAACDLLTPHGRDVVISEWDGTSCEQALATALRQTPQSEFDKLRNAKIEKVEVAGDTALVTSNDPDRPAGVLRRVGGRWRVEVMPR